MIPDRHTDGPFDPGVATARDRADALPPQTGEPIVVSSSLVRVGTASWTDPTLLERGVFYPPDARDAESRLRFYASRFPVVEVDSGYYALPTRSSATAWVERTPDHFTFDVKAYAPMTGHPTDVARLPRDLREALTGAGTRARSIAAAELPAEILDEVWRRFLDAIAPLHEAGKLGAVLLQYPPWEAPTCDSPALLERARERLGAIPAAVEFRHAGWLAPRLRERTWDLLRRLDFSYTIVDEPQGTASSVPPLVAVTRGQLAVIRLHGQRADRWQKRGVPAVEKYRYLYDRDELLAWLPRIRAAAEEASVVHVLFNNCFANYGTTNAAELSALLAARSAGGS